LQHATQAVKDAINAEQISLGHAELISTLPAETQDKLLQRVIEQGITIQALREQLEGFSLPLDKAIFDKAGCEGCPHNSGGAQQELFSATIAVGRCSNRPCFTAKTQVALDAQREALKEDYATVAFSTEKMPGTTIPLVMLGSCGVGSEQFAACKSFAFRGAVIDARIGNTTGQVEGPLCFNRPCNAKMVEAYQQSLAPPPAAGAGEGNDADEENDDDGQSPSTAASAAATTPRAKAKPKPGKKASAPAARATPEAVNVLYDTAMRAAVVEHMQSDPRWTLALAVYGLARIGSTELQGKDLGGLLKEAGIPVPKTGGMCGADTAILLAVAAAEKPVLQQALVTLSRTFIGHEGNASFNQHRVNRRQLAATLSERATLDVAKHIAVTDAYLAAHTKAGIESVLDESGFAAWMREQPEGTKKYKALLSSGKGDLIKGVLAAGYDFSGYLPSGLVELRKQMLKAK